MLHYDTPSSELPDLCAQSIPGSPVCTLPQLSATCPGQTLHQMPWDNLTHTSHVSSCPTRASHELSIPGHPSMHPVRIQLSSQGTYCMWHPRMPQTTLHLGFSPCIEWQGHPSLHPSLPPPNLQVPTIQRIPHHPPVCINFGFSYPARASSGDVWRVTGIPWPMPMPTLSSSHPFREAPALRAPGPSSPCQPQFQPASHWTHMST